MARYRPRLAVGFAALLLAWTATAQAGSIRHDVDESEYIDLAALPQFDAAGAINPGAGALSGVLVSPYWVLTAAHNVGSLTFQVEGGAPITSASYVVVPGWTGDVNQGYDLALVRLTSPITAVDPALLYSGKDELTSTATLVGYGVLRDGNTGAIEGARGVRRAGTNIIDRYATFTGGITPQSADGSDRVGLLWDFDSPLTPPTKNRWGSPTPLPLEYQPALGDSGSPLFVEIDGQFYVMGITSAILNGQNGTANQYGAAAVFTRVSSFNNYVDGSAYQHFVEDTISNRWIAAIDGVFHAGANWLDAGRFDADYTAFTVVGAYAVTFDEDAESRKLIVRQGAVTFDLDGHLYAQTHPSLDASVVVGRSSGDAASLSLQGGGTLASIAAFLAAENGSTGAVNVTDGSLWTVAHNLVIGGTHTASGGTGMLNVDGGAIDVAGLLSIATAGSSASFTNTTSTASAIDNAGALNVGTAAALIVAGGLTGNGHTTVSGAGASLVVDHIVQNSLTIGEGALVTLAPTIIPVEPTAFPTGDASFDGGSFGGDSLTASAVPEPGTLALSAILIAIAAAMLRRRRG
jgi:hypothetical protein